MPQTSFDRFLDDLATALCESPLREKWLLAPSRRVGFQWLDQLAANSRPVLNVRVKTTARLAIDLAAPEMDRSGLSYVRGIGVEALTAKLFEQLKRSGLGYLSELDSTPGLVKYLVRAVSDLRLSGISSEDLDPAGFEVEAKGRELKMFLGLYETELREHDQVDYADVVRLATSTLSDHGLRPADCSVVVAQDLQKGLRPLEAALLKAMPPGNVTTLEPQSSEPAPAEDLTDAQLLKWLADPKNAAAPKNDGTATVYSAVGEVNEVREVFRRCVEKGLAFDQVEVLHTDSATYVPLIYETAWSLALEGADSIPATFSEGLPTSFCRPGRALAAWVSWISEGFPQPVLARMIQDGLLEIDQPQEDAISFTRLAAALRALRIGVGADRYLPAIENEIELIQSRNSGRSSSNNMEPEEFTRRQANRLRPFEVVRGLVRGLLAALPDPSNPKAVLNAADGFLDSYARCANQFDAYGKERLQKDVRELAEHLTDEEAWPGLNVWDWLRNLALTASVGGQGPRPGCIYVAPLMGGGHSGRKHVFIVGLDDSRFPGAGLQDPLLLDQERDRVSPRLPTAAGRSAKKLKEFSEVIARLRGSVTLSYCCRNLDEDREMFPSPVLLQAFRVISGQRDGDQEAFIEWLSDRVSFAPDSAASCLNVADWWVHVLCGEGIGHDDRRDALFQGFPHLAQGDLARQHREIPVFTEYDGYVPAAGEVADPTGPGGPVMSPTRLETLGRCPMAYFFKHILGIEAVDEYLPPVEQWLAPQEKGTLLHSVFREFISRLIDRGELPIEDRDMPELLDILNKEIESWRAECPPQNEEVFRRGVNELRQIARIFLHEEEVFCSDSRPVYCEASLGLEAEDPGTPLDTKDPVEIEVPGGGRFLARGRIDRIDEATLLGRKVFTVWDYKTGGSRGFDRNDPLLGGRRVQSVLYRLMAEKRLREVHPDNWEIGAFGYFFPNAVEHGERIFWHASQLTEATEALADLVEMIRLGCFPFSDDLNDAKYSEYRAAFGDLETAQANVKLKLDDPDNVALAPFRRLRGYE